MILISWIIAGIISGSIIIWLSLSRKKYMTREDLALTIVMVVLGWISLVIIIIGFIDVGLDLDRKWNGFKKQLSKQFDKIVIDLRKKRSKK